MEDVFKTVYYTAENPGSFSGRQRLKDETAKLCKERISDKDAAEWLMKQDVYTLFRGARKNFKRNRTLVHGIDVQFQADLVDMVEYMADNDGYRYMLMCIDTFSKYAWVRCLKNKNAKTVVKAFEDILSEGRVPNKLQTDKGTEFFNNDFGKLMEKYKIHHFATSSEIKASIVERFNRTFKGRMYRSLEARNSKRYIDIVHDITRAYNGAYHRSIKMAPADVTRDNEREVLNIMYQNRVTETPVFRFKPGDIVRISKARRTFGKGYKQSYTDEYFTISQRVYRKPPVYLLRDQLGELIEGTFYEAELQKIIVPEDFTYKIESIVSRKRQGGKKQLLVKWKGWPDKFNSWVDEKDIVELS